MDMPALEKGSDDLQGSVMACEPFITIRVKDEFLRSYMFREKHLEAVDMYVLLLRIISKGG